MNAASTETPQPRARRLRRAFAGLACRFRREERGATILVFALSLLPLIGIVGVGLEYSRGLLYRARLSAAADSAAIAAITTARAYISDNAATETNPTPNAIKAGLARAKAVFSANAGSQLLTTPLTPTITLTRTGQTLDATASYQTTFPTPFGKLFGTPNLTVAGNAGASLQLENYIDFYLLLDTSGSMGFPTSKAQQISFAKMNPDMRDGSGVNNCAFACHFLNKGWKGYDLAKTNNIELRIATVGKAVQSLLDTAKAKRKLANQFRVGLYPFVSFMETAATATSNLDSLYPTAGALENYMDLGDSSLPRGSGGTHYENLFPAINSKITTVGDGSSSTNPKAFVFLVTDGVSNNQYWYNATGWTGSQANLLDSNLCTPLKMRGVTISILYVPYEPLVQPYNTNVGYENVRVNSLIPSVPQTLKDCASANYFRTASTAEEITAALNAMFEQAVAVARLTN